MKFLTEFFIIYLTTYVISDEKINPCRTCIKVNGTCHNLTHLFQLQGQFRNQIVIPKMLVHVQKNVLYYSFEPKIAMPEYYKVGFVSLDQSKEYGILGSSNDSKQLFNFGTFAIDENAGIIYLGGSDGIFQLDTNSKSVTPYSSRGDTISAIFYRGHVYFTVFPENKIRIKKGDLFEEVKGFENEYVKDFVIDRTGVIYFLGLRGLFARKYNINDTVLLSDNAFFRGMTMDRNGDLYTWWIDGIYKLFKNNDWKKSSLEKVADLPSIGALTFDKDNNFLLTLGRSLFKLIPTDEFNCIYAENPPI